MTRTETLDKAVQSRLKTFNRWWKKNGDLKFSKSKRDNFMKKKAQRALILAAKRSTVAYACSDLEKQTVYFCEKRYNNSKWPKLTKEEAWTMFKLGAPVYGHRLELLKSSAEKYSLERQEWSNELKELRALREQFGDRSYSKPTHKKPVITYKRKAS